MTNTKNNGFVPDVKARFDDFVRKLGSGEHFKGFVKDLEAQLRICESPIEQILLIEFSDLLVEHNLTNFCEIIPQVWAYYTDAAGESDAKVFGVRLDFLICFQNNWDYIRSPYEGLWPPQHRPSLLPLFAVECDGRDFHSNEASIQRDKTRDRILTTLGLTTIRFTGSEIYNNPSNSAWAVFNLFLVHFRDILEFGSNRSEFISLNEYPPRTSGSKIDTPSPRLKKFKRLFLSDRPHKALLEYDASYISDDEARELGLLDDE
jgi:hypothetical protein